jgi:diacylglycerol kinase (ATP)
MHRSEVGFIKGRLRSFRYAFRGAWLLIRTEHSIMVQLFVAFAVSVAGYFANLSATEWILQILAISGVLVSEALNTAIEKLCDFVHPDHSNHIGMVKDISAGAVTFAALAAVVIGIIIYFPRFAGLF